MDYRKHILTMALLLVVLLVAMCMPATAENEENVFMKYRGNCGAEGDGSHLTWEVTTDRKTLTITGSGAMADYNETNRPWMDKIEEAKETLKSMYL